MWLYIRCHRIRGAGNKNIVVESKRSARSCVAIVCIMTKYEEGTLKFNNPCEWSPALLKKPGLRRSRYEATEYPKSICNARSEKRIGFANERILWPDEIVKVVTRICTHSDTVQVCTHA